MLDYLTIFFIRFFVNPLGQKRYTEYRNFFNDSKNIIISCPAEEKDKNFGISIKKFSDLFQKKSVTVLYPEKNIKGCKMETDTVNGLPKKIKYNLLHLINSDHLNKIYNQKFDVLIDLDPNVNVLNILLCRKLNPALRISFDKAGSNHFYNIRYNLNPQKPYSENRSNLYHFLKSMINQK
ncbi:MAG: hypothetical protein R6V04_12570 [bacterium]